MPIVVAEEITRSYQLGKDNFVHALRGASMRVENGEFVAIMGPSGSGKSTLLRIIGCLDEVTGGRFFFRGRDVTNLNASRLTRVRARDVGFIFQTANLIPTLTALENVMMVAEYAGMKGRAKVKRATEMLERVGLGGRLHHRPSELSGGEQQRVAIARALVKGPAIILADEPTGNLDSVTAEETMDLLRDVRDVDGRSVVIVTHDARMAAYADRIIFLRDGRVVDEETPSGDWQGGDASLPKTL